MIIITIATSCDFLNSLLDSTQLDSILLYSAWFSFQNSHMHSSCVCASSSSASSSTTKTKVVVNVSYLDTTVIVAMVADVLDPKCLGARVPIQCTIFYKTTKCVFCALPWNYICFVECVLQCASCTQLQQQHHHHHCQHHWRQQKITTVD